MRYRSATVVEFHDLPCVCQVDENKEPGAPRKRAARRTPQAESLRRNCANHPARARPVVAAVPDSDTNVGIACAADTARRFAPSAFAKASDDGPALQ